MAAANMGRVDFDPVHTPVLPDYDAAELSGISVKAFFASAFCGIGQVYLRDNIVLDVLVLVSMHQYAYRWLSLSLRSTRTRKSAGSIKNV